MAASPQQAAFDIRSLSAFPIRLGRSAQQTAVPAKYSSVQYNHKPSISSPDRATTSINPPESGSKQYSLRLKDGNDEYQYKGSQATGEHTYVLIPDQEEDGYVLEKLESSYSFNLSKAPWELNTQLLAKRYPQLEAAHQDDDEEGELFGHGAAYDEGEADSDNPFDFRHYMNAVESPSPPVQPTKNNVVGTPSSVASHGSTRTNTPLARSMTKKPPSAFALQEKRIAAKAKVKAKPAQPSQSQSQTQTQRARASPDTDARQIKQDVPTVRLDRRASTRVVSSSRKSESRQQRPRDNDNDTDGLSLDFADDDINNNNNDDEGDLILEGDAPTTSSYRNQRSLGAALSGALGAGSGPRSLLSAASSPASQLNSPRSLQQSSNNHDNNNNNNRNRGRRSPYERHVDTDGEEIEIDMGPDSPGERSPGGEDLELELELDEDEYANQQDAESDSGELVMDDGGELVMNDGNMDVDANAADDEDVDEMHLPSPAQVHRPSVSNTVVTADDEDDLENQMLLALEGGDDEMSGGLQESEEESEEE